MESNTFSYTECHEIINNLIHKYTSNSYALSRIKIYLNNLDHTIEMDISNYEKRQSRTNELNNEYDIFCKVFLSKNKYYYLSNNNCFYEYDNKTYKIIKEDDIHYQLLSNIREDGKLIQWKHKTKSNIIKLIKDRKLFHSIPETYTIQTVLGFLQSAMFPSKLSAKYFLTILGDHLLKKSNSYIFCIHPDAKKILSYIDELSYITSGISINNFVTKYHASHLLSNYRILKTKEIQISNEVIKDILHKIGIDLLCVAAHYSHRYQSSEAYLQDISIFDKEFASHTLFLFHNSQEEIINKFVQQCFIHVFTDEQTNQPMSISWKNMHYIWKMFLSQINIPNIIYTQPLKDILKSKLTFDEDKDAFVHITSKYLPEISIFLQFWEKHITINNDNTFNEYEIEEISSLFKYVQESNVSITEHNMLNIIKHFFYPEVQIMDNKFIVNIQCNLWDKRHDITMALQDFKISIKNEILDDLIPFDELYNIYHSYYKMNMTFHKQYSLIVSKVYFEKYIRHYLNDYITFENFIDLKLLLNS